MHTPASPNEPDRCVPFLRNSPGYYCVNAFCFRGYFDYQNCAYSCSLGYMLMGLFVGFTFYGLFDFKC